MKIKIINMKKLIKQDKWAVAIIVASIATALVAVLLM